MRSRNLSLAFVLIAACAFVFVAGCSGSKRSASRRGSGATVDIQQMTDRFMASVPTQEYKAQKTRVSERTGNFDVIYRIKGWRGDVKKTDSLTAPVVGEITFRFYSRNDFMDKGKWDNDFIEGKRTRKAIYHVVNGKWKLQDILTSSTDSSKWFSTSEKEPLNFEEMRLALPDNF
jgi:hypothetical protein